MSKDREHVKQIKSKTIPSTKIKFFIHGPVDFQCCQHRTPFTLFRRFLDVRVASASEQESSESDWIIRQLKVIKIHLSNAKTLADFKNSATNGILCRHCKKLLPSSMNANDLSFPAICQRTDETHFRLLITSVCQQKLYLCLNYFPPN